MHHRPGRRRSHPFRQSREFAGGGRRDTQPDRLAELRSLPERYVVWGEGTIDEMGLGILSVTRP